MFAPISSNTLNYNRGLKKFLKKCYEDFIFISMNSTEVVAGNGSVKVFLTISQNLQENASVGIFFLIKLQAPKTFLEHFVEHVPRSPSVPTK